MYWIQHCFHTIPSKYFIFVFSGVFYAITLPPGLQTMSYSQAKLMLFLACLKCLKCPLCVLKRQHAFCMHDWYMIQHQSCWLQSYLVHSKQMLHYMFSVSYQDQYFHFLTQPPDNIFIFRTVDERPSHGGLSYQLVSVKTLPLFLGDDRFQPTTQQMICLAISLP